MLHGRQHAALLLKASQDLARVHAALQELQRHFPFHRVRLLRAPHETEPALAQFFHQAKGSQNIAGLFIAAFQRLHPVLQRVCCGGC